MDAEFTTSGAFFNERARGAAIRAFGEQAERDVADVGERLVRARLGRVLQNPTGAYESRIMTDRSAGDSRVTDDRAIYGPWLEGTGERNKTTRFKGYATFRRTTQELQRLAGRIAERRLSALIRKLGG